MYTEARGICIVTVVAIRLIVGLLPNDINAHLHALFSTALAQALPWARGALQVEVPNFGWLITELLSMSLNVFAEGVILLKDLVDHMDHVVSDELLVHSPTSCT